jgi:hypothetical protein
MNTLDIKPGERVKDVHFTEDTLSVDVSIWLTDERLPYPWHGIPGCFTLHRNNVRTGKYAAVDTASIGRTLMRI